MSESILSVNQSIFPCSNCGQLIYSYAETCRFCSTPVDHKVAALSAALQTRVNTACNQAKLLRNSAGAMWIFFLLGLLPFMPFGWGFTGLFFVIPAWLVFWQFKFGRLETPDTDYKRAKRDRLVALIIWLPALAVEVLALVIPPLVRKT